MQIFNLLPSKLLSSQARKPSGIIGRFVMTTIFNKGNAELNAFVKENLDLQPDDRVLEIGFGPGKLIKEIANITTNVMVEGIDYSKTMLKQAAKENSLHISSGRVLLHEGDCASLPFENNSFDKLCSANTLYFWRNPEDYIPEIFRVIRPGGIVVIGFRDSEQMSHLSLSKDIFRLFSKNDVINLLSDAGFINVQIKEKDGAPFASYCGVATKPYHLD